MLMGRGSVAEMRAIQQGRADVRGRVVSEAKYLGNIRQANGGTGANTDCRRRAAQESFFLLSGLWGKRRVSRNVTKRVFHSNVVSAALSGLEAEVLTRGDYERLDTLLVGLARRAWGSGASYEGPDGTRKWRPNEAVRKWMGLATVESELQCRRAKWWQSVIRDPGKNVQLLAVHSAFWTWRRARGGSSA